MNRVYEVVVCALNDEHSLLRKDELDTSMSLEIRGGFAVMDVERHLFLLYHQVQVNAMINDLVIDHVCVILTAEHLNACFVLLETKECLSDVNGIVLTNRDMRGKVAKCGLDYIGKRVRNVHEFENTLE